MAHVRARLRETPPQPLSIHCRSPALIDVRKPAGSVRRITCTVGILRRPSGSQVDVRAAVADVGGRVLFGRTRRVVVHCRIGGLPVIHH